LVNSVCFFIRLVSHFYYNTFIKAIATLIAIKKTVHYERSFSFLFFTYCYNHTDCDGEENYAEEYGDRNKR